jgi:hypothetical protein
LKSLLSFKGPVEIRLKVPGELYLQVVFVDDLNLPTPVSQWNLVDSHGRWKGPCLQTSPPMRPGGALTI